MKPWNGWKILKDSRIVIHESNKLLIKDKYGNTVKRMNVSKEWRLV